jgi:hypothetical protein
LVSLKGSAGGWFRNLEADPQVRLRIRGGFFRGRAREISDAGELDRAKDVYAGALNRLDWIEYRMHRADKPTVAKIRSMYEKWFDDGTPVVIELET